MKIGKVKSFSKDKIKSVDVESVFLPFAVFFAVHSNFCLMNPSPTCNECYVRRRGKIRGSLFLSLSLFPFLNLILSPSHSFSFNHILSYTLFISLFSLNLSLSLFFSLFLSLSLSLYLLFYYIYFTHTHANTYTHTRIKP